MDISIKTQRQGKGNKGRSGAKRKGKHRYWANGFYLSTPYSKSIQKIGPTIVTR